MRKLLFFLIIMLINNHVYTQIYFGNSSYNCRCFLYFDKDSTVTFLYSRDGNVIYAEYTGKIKNINGTLYHISTSMIFGQFYMKTFNPDTFYVQIDTSLIKMTNKMKIYYSNDKSMNIVDFKNNPHKWTNHCIYKYQIDKNFFNDKFDSNFIIVTIDRRHLVTGEQLKFKIPYGSAIDFETGYKMDFDVVIQNDSLWTTGEIPINTGHFRQEKE